MIESVRRTIMVEHRYKSNDVPGAFGGFEWTGETTDLLHTPGWFADYVQEIAIGVSKKADFLETLYFTTSDNRQCVAEPGDIVVFRLGRLVVCSPDICKFFLKELM